ncbi:hypothetical protein [Methanobacterium sp. BAmetb5]|uniref:hypothetical protein n=1 Tax=Methanobacterium sp. BAmetb5 TaxID=2025351 RepID=UPI000E91A500|nr:hypothetical protein [Methanobacterium sp. BAmetb5]AXV40398.1 MAG: hypothetical protein CIT02_08730 [Methanobacterium sp. BAmetb5]
MVAKLNLAEMFKYGLFQDPIILGDNLEEVRNYIHNFKLESSGIDILSFQPGVGKTHHTNELLKKMNSYLLVTGSHKLLKGEYSALRAKYWQGFPEKCKEYKGQVQKLDSYGVSIKTICQIQSCDRRTCPYWKQFNTKKAIAPYHFLTSDRVLNKEGKYKFDMLLVDEAMEYGTEYTLKEESLNESIQAMGKYENVKFLEEVDWGADLLDYLQENIKLINRKKYSSLNGAIRGKQWDDVKKIAKFRPYNLIKYYYYHTIYGNSSCYYEPLLYTVFDLARQKLPIIMLDASFDVKAYEVTLARYNFEHKNKPRDPFINQPLGPITDLLTRSYDSNIRDKHKTIYRMDKNNYYYKTGIWDFNNKKLTENGKKTEKELKSFINKIKRKYHHVGIITYQDLEPLFEGLGKTEHFFNLRGSNKLKNVDALFIIGTPQKKVSGILKGYNKLCLTDFTEESIYKPIYKIQDGMNCIYHEYVDCYGKHEHWDCNSGDGYREKKPVSYRFKGDYEDWYHEELRKQREAGEIDLELWYKFSEYAQNQDESEKYQAIHRARPFLKDNPIIYVFGDIPEKIKQEFTIVSYDKDNTRIHFSRDYRGVYPLALGVAISEYYYNTGSTSAEIAKEFRLYKRDNKKSYNTPFITKIIKEITPHNLRTIDKLLKEDISLTPAAIKRRHPNINIDREMIEDFIFYAKGAAFIRM